MLVGGFECATAADAVGATAVLSYLDNNMVEQNEQNRTLEFTIICGMTGPTENQLLMSQTFPNDPGGLLRRPT